MVSVPTQTIVEEIKKTPGWFSQFNNTMNKVREQGGVDAQKSLASDVEIRDLEATIDMKGAQSALYKAQYAQSLSALSMPAQKELNDIEKAALESTTKAYDELFKMQLQEDFTNKLKNDSKFRELWTKTYDEFQAGLPANGLTMDIASIESPRILIEGKMIPMLGVLKTTGGGFGAGANSDLAGAEQDLLNYLNTPRP